MYASAQVLTLATCLSPSPFRRPGATAPAPDFDRFSLSNVEAGSRKLWVHLVSLHVVSIYTLWVSACRVSVAGQRGMPRCATRCTSLLCSFIRGVQMHG